MGIGFGRLKSPLPHPELRNSIVRLTNEWISLCQQRINAAAGSDFKTYFNSFEGELLKLSDIGLKTKVILVRLQESLKIVESNLQSKKSQLRVKSGQDTDVRQLTNQIDSYLSRIREIKRRIKEEETKCVLDERKILGNL